VSYRLLLIADSNQWLLTHRLVLEIIFVLLQVTLIKCFTKFAYNGFIESIYHSLGIFYNH